MNKDKQLTYKECQRRMDAESNIGFQLYKRRLKKALSSQRKEIVEKIEKIKEIKETKEDKEVHKILIKAGGEQVRGEIIGQRNGYNRALEEIINLIKEDE